MNALKLLFLIFITTSFTVNGQKADSTKLKRIEIHQRIDFELGSYIYKPEKLVYRTADKKYVFPWQSTYRNTADFIEILDSINRSARVSVEYDTYYNATQVKFKGRFPIKNEQLENADYRIQLISSNIKDSTGKQLELQENSTKGFHTSSTFTFTNNVSSKKTTGLTEIENKLNPSITHTNVHGTVKYRAEFITGYEFVKITRQDKGKEFVLNNQKFKVVNILENKVILAPVNLKKLDHFKIVNVTTDNKRISPLSLVEAKELEQKDSTYKGKISIAESSTIVSEFLVNQFKKNPDMTLKEYTTSTFSKYQAFTESTEKDKKAQFFGASYTLIQTTGPIQNLYLYWPVYGAQKEIEVKF